MMDRKSYMRFHLVPLFLTLSNLERSIQVPQPGCGPQYTPNWKEAIVSILIQFCHMPERYKRFLVGWHCAKVKGRVELKIEQPQSKDL